MTRLDRKGKRGGGGGAIYLKAPLKFSVLSSSSDSVYGSIEYLMGEVSFSKTNIFLLCAVYCPPNSPFYKNTDFLQNLQLHCANYSSKIILGDIDANMLTDDPYSKIIKHQNLKSNHLK